MEKICPNCGASMLETSKFCTECGKPFPAPQPKPEVKKEEPPKPEPQQPQPEPQQPQPEPNPQPQQQTVPNPQPIGTYDPATGKFTQPKPAKHPKQPKPANPQPIGTYPPAAEGVPGENSPYQPVTASGWYGVMWLLRLPVIGFILTVIWACGGCRKINKRNYCRAMLIDLVTTLIIIGIIGAFGFAILKKVMADPATQSALESIVGGFLNT